MNCRTNDKKKSRKHVLPWTVASCHNSPPFPIVPTGMREQQLDGQWESLDDLRIAARVESRPKGGDVCILGNDEIEDHYSQLIFL